MSAPADDAVLMLKAGVIVAAVAVPVAVVSALVARRQYGAVCPRWAMPRFVWPGAVIFGLFVSSQFDQFAVPFVEQAGLYRTIYPNGFPHPAPGTEEDARRVAATLKAIWLGLGWVPVVLLAAILLRRFAFDAPINWRGGVKQVPRVVALGAVGLLSFGAVTHLLQAGVSVLFERWGLVITEHPLSKMGANGDGMGGALLVLSACVKAPLLEEFLFRGLLVPWAGGRWYRPWVLLFAAGALATQAGDGWASAALGFVAVLGVTQYAIQRYGKRLWRKMPKRTVLAVWSSSALFAAAHSSVWPTPIPLFILALGLGYLTARTRSWAAAAVAHSLFNLVSTVFVFLRG